MHNRHAKQGCGGENSSIIRSISSSSTRKSQKSSSKNKSSSRSLRHGIPICHQLLQHMVQSCLQPSSTPSIENAAFRRFCVSTNHLTTWWPAIPLQFGATLISTHDGNLQSTSRHPGWSQQIFYHKRSPPKTGNSKLNGR